MKALIKKILRESEEFDWVGDIVDNTDLPFEVESEPANRPKKSDMFVVKTGWEYGDSYLREDFVFLKNDKKEFITFINVCKFYSALLNSRGYERWRDVQDLAKSVGLSMSSWEEDDNYGTTKDMSDFVFGSDFPAYLDSIEIFYYDHGGVEYRVNLK